MLNPYFDFSISQLTNNSKNINKMVSNISNYETIQSFDYIYSLKC